MSKLDKVQNEITYIKTDSLLDDARKIIDSAQAFAYSAINYAITQRNWLLGRRIAEEDLQGERRAEYGKQIVKNLAAQLSETYGKGFDASNLYKYIDFYKAFPILDAACLKSLSWSHFRILLQAEKKEIFRLQHENGECK